MKYLPLLFLLPLATFALDTKLPNTNVTTISAYYWKVQQQTFKIGWDRVTTRVNGVALPATEIASYTLYRAPAGVTAPDRVDVRTMAKSSTYSTTVQPLCTTYRYAITVTDTKGVESPASEPVNVTTYCPAQ